MVFLQNMSPVKQKILLLLLGGLDFAYGFTPERRWRALKNISYQWKKIDERELREEVNRLHKSKLVKKEYKSDGSCSLSITEKGKIKILSYKFSEMEIRSDHWDGKWRMVVFDVPEKIRRGRNALRWKLKLLGFYELQKSVFVLPYECKDEIDFIVEFFGLRKYVHYGILESIDNDIHLKQVFNLK